MGRNSSFRIWLTRIRPLAWALACFALVLFGYTFTTTIPTDRLTVIASILGVTALALPWLFNPEGDWRELRTLGILALPLSVAILGEGYNTALWSVLLIPAIAIPQMLPPRWAFSAIALMVIAWAVSNVLVPAVAVETMAIEVGLRSLGFVLVAIAVWLAARPRFDYPAMLPEAPIRRATRAAERLRGSLSPEETLEELASAAKACGPFIFASASTVDWRARVLRMAVAIGGSGRTLGATEMLSIPWDEITVLLRDDRRIGDNAYLSDSLPFRDIAGEHYMLVPVRTATGEICGLLTVGDDDPKARKRLTETAPLLELLASQAAAVLENAALQNTLAQRIEATTAEMGRTAEDAMRARTRAESMYQIVRALSGTLEPQPLLDQALLLIAQATQAERGGIMLIDHKNGRLAFSTNLDRNITRTEAISLERGQGLAGWVVEHRAPVIIPNTAEDSRWMVRSDYDKKGRSALAVPMEQDGRVAGVIVLINSRINHFTQEHIQFVQVIGDQVMTMLSNVQLYRATTEQARRLSQALEQREEEVSRSLAIVRSIGDGVVVGDRVGRIRLINPAAEQLLNIEAAEWLGKPLMSLPGAPESEPRLTEKQTYQQFELSGRMIRASSTPVFTSQSEWLGSVVVYHDITAAELADRMKTEFVATASHELRTPLTSISGYIDLLMLNTLGPLTEQQRQFLSVVKNNIERLNAILNDLLDVSRIESGKVRLQRKPINLDEVIQSTVMAIHQQWSSKQISLALDVPDDLPPVIADPERMRQIVTNLISNAYKYTRDGGRIDVVVSNGGDSVTLAVKDSGVGIAADDQKHIFTRFFRSENPLKEQAGGTGLGLNITKSLVELHGGKIWFDSEEGRGTTFTVQLPVGGDSDWTPASWLEGV